MGGAPLVFASIYLIKLKSEKSLEKVPSGTSDFDSIDLEEKSLNPMILVYATSMKKNSI
jgi:hypothetical protein